MTGESINPIIVAKCLDGMDQEHYALFFQIDDAPSRLHNKLHKIIFDRFIVLHSRAALVDKVGGRTAHIEKKGDCYIALYLFLLPVYFA